MNLRSILLTISALSLLTAAGCAKEEKASPSEAPAAKTAAAEPGAEVASAPAPEKLEANAYGEAITAKDTVAIAEILKDPSAYKGKKVRVEGMVTDVCPKRGCWFDMAGTEPGQKMRFKVQDGVMVFPMEAKGKHAVAEGVVSVRELSMEETLEYMAYQAEELGKEFDPKSVTEPTTIVRLDGSGAEIRDKK